MKDISRMTWIIMISSFLVLTILIGTSTKLMQKLTYKEAIAVEINSEQIETDIQLEKESKSADHFTSYKSYPTTSIDEIDDPIYKWVKANENDFLEKIAKSQEIQDGNFTGVFNLDAEVNKLTDDLFSVKLQSEETIDESDEKSSVKTFVINLKSEELIDLDDIFDDEKFTEKDRFQLMAKQLDEEDKELDYDTWKPSLEDINDLEVFIDTDKLTFYFTDDDLIKGEENILEVPVSTTQLADYFTTTYYDLLISDEMESEIEQAKIEEEQTKEEEIAGHKYIALTFDDGPEPNSTNRILETLDQYDAKATFFMLSNKVEANPDLANKVADNGHEIANHSVTHADLGKLGRNQIRNEMINSKEKIENITGVTPTLFRPPYGSKNEMVHEVASETDQSIALWSIDTYDWQHLNPNATFEKIQNNVKPGSIILMHDIHQQTADALPRVMEYLDEQGYEFVTMSELLPYIEGEGIGPYYGN